MSMEVQSHAQPCEGWSHGSAFSGIPSPSPQNEPNSALPSKRPASPRASAYAQRDHGHLLITCLLIRSI